MRLPLLAYLLLTDPVIEQPALDQWQEAEVQRIMIQGGVVTGVALANGDPWMPASQYSHALQGLTLNLLVRDIARSLPFHREVLGAQVVYSDVDFAVLRHGEVEWMLHECTRNEFRGKVA